MPQRDAWAVARAQAVEVQARAGAELGQVAVERVLVVEVQAQGEVAQEQVVAELELCEAARGRAAEVLALEVAARVQEVVGLVQVAAVLVQGVWALAR